jgi:hypothetical protein
MTEAEQLAWVAGLGKTKPEQARALHELLRYANGDEMSAADREICTRQLARLEAELGWKGRRS